MSSDSQHNNDNQEIDLSQISKKIGSFFEDIATSFFRGILFFKRNILIIGILFVLGAALGFYLDKTSKSYDNQIIVSPNFGTSDYLYDKISLINSKVLDGDTLFLKNVVGIQHPKKFGKIEIKPIIDVFKFVENKEENFELIKLMAEDGDIKKVLNDKVTSKNYPFHEISYSTSEITSKEKTLDPILKYLNDSKYYSQIQKESVNNYKIKTVKNDSILNQIDRVLNSFSSKKNTNEKLIYYNENTQLNDIIKTKTDLVNEQGYIRVELLNLDRIIKDCSSTINIKNTESVNGKLKLVLPFLFIILFVLGGFFKSFYKRQLAKSKL
jgi:hypothetical protein